MKKILLIFFIFISFNSYAENLVIVDIDYILKNSKIGKTTSLNLQKSRKKMVDNFKQQEKKFNEEENQILSKRSILSKDEFAKEIDKLRKEVVKYKGKKIESLKNFKIDREKQYTKIYKKINEVLIDYSKKNDIKTVIDKKYVLISKSETDITEKIIKLFDN